MRVPGGGPVSGGVRARAGGVVGGGASGRGPAAGGGASGRGAAAGASASGRNTRGGPPCTDRFRPLAQLRTLPRTTRPRRGPLTRASGRNARHPPPGPVRIYPLAEPQHQRAGSARSRCGSTSEPIPPAHCHARRSLPARTSPAHRAPCRPRPQSGSTRPDRSERSGTLSACPSPTASRQLSADAPSASARPCAAASRRADSDRDASSGPSTARAAGPRPPPIRIERARSHHDSGTTRHSATRPQRSSSASRCPVGSRLTGAST